MELFLSAAALGAFALLPASAPLLLRCGLSACLRFSPRAALALSSAAALAGCASMLLCRGGIRAVLFAQREPAVLAGILGGTTGRMLLLLFTARFSGSLELAKVQSVPLLLIAAAALLPRRFPLPQSKAALFAFSLLCAMTEGFFGCGGMPLFMLAGKRNLHRRRFSAPGAALLLCAAAQLSALLLTLLSGAAQVFPVRALLTLMFAAALGGAVFEKTKKRAAIQKGLRIALYTYLILAALAGVEQAFFVQSLLTGE